jgi:hypothetical protein
MKWYKANMAIMRRSWSVERAVCGNEANGVCSEQIDIAQRNLAEVISATTDQLDRIESAQTLKGYIKDAAIDLERYLRFDFPFFFFLSTPGSGFGVDEDG